jgi:hypothetical protein
MNIMKFLKDGFSLDEFKTSSLVIMFIVFSIVAVYGYITTGDISMHWLDLLITMIYVIGGVNAVRGISEITSKKQDKEIEYQNESFEEIDRKEDSEWQN